MSYPGRIITPAVVLGLALLAAGCGSSSSDRSPGGSFEIPPSSDAEPSGGPAPLPDSSPPPTPALQPVTPAPGLRERTARWQPAGQSDGGRRVLVDVVIGGPPCDTVTGVDVVESRTTVTVTVFAGRLTSADCPPGSAGTLATARVEARLAEPLGDRKLLGGAPEPASS